MLQTWLGSRGFRVRHLEQLPGDVSPRRYFRVELVDGSSAIGAVYPQGQESACHRFAESSRILERVEVRVPRLLDLDCSLGLMLVEDVGSQTLYELAESGWGELHQYFEEAVRHLRRIASIPVERVANLNPPLDTTLLRRELAQTWELFLAPKRLIGDDESAKHLRVVLDDLCLELGQERMIPCHRDFMARNLVPFGSTATVVVLDHQDLRLGPKFYDLASLLNDSLFPPPEIEETLLQGWLASEKDLLGYHRAAAQRTLKAIGTFASFSRRGAHRHDRLILPSLARAWRHLCALPEAAAVQTLLDSLWRPFLEARQHDLSEERPEIC